MSDAHREEIQKLEALYADHPEGRIFTHLAEAYRKAGELDRARSVLDEGLQRHPDYSSAHVVLGRVLVDQGERREAEAAFHRVLELDAHNMVALRSLADIARADGRAEDALDFYDRLLEVEPADTDVRQLADEVRASVAGTGWSESEPDAGAGGAMPGDLEPSESAGFDPSQTPAGFESAETPAGFEPSEAPTGFEASEGPGDLDRSEGAGEVDRPETPAEAEEGWAPHGLVEGSPFEEAAWSLSDEPERPTEPGAPEGEPGAEPEEPRWDPFGEAEAEPLPGESTGADRLPSWEDVAEAPADETTVEDASVERSVESASEPTWAPAGDADPAGAAADAGDAGGAGEQPPRDPFATSHFAGTAAEEAGAGEAADAAEEERDPWPPLGSPGVMTETIAQVYARQGLYDRAAEVYRGLVRERPEDESLRDRLAEMEELAAHASETAAESAPAADALEDEGPWRDGGHGGEDAAYAAGSVDGLEPSGLESGEVGAAPVEGLETREVDPETHLVAGSEADVAEPEEGSVWTGGEWGEPEGESPYAWTEPETEPEADDSAPIDQYFKGLLAWSGTGVAATEPGAAAEPSKEAAQPSAVEETGDEASDHEASSGEAAAERSSRGASSSGGLAEEPSGEASESDGEDDDLDMFRSWLESLKQ